MKASIIIILALIGVLVAGCSSETKLTETEEQALKNRPKTIPPEAVEGMKNMGELIKKQQEENAKRGVDSRGIPLEKSTDKR